MRNFNPIQQFAISAIILAVFGGNLATAADAKLDALDERVTELEVQRALNKITFSGTMINRYEAYNSTATDTTTGTVSKEALRAPLTYFGLNADVNVSKAIKLYSTLAFSKYWNQDGRSETPGYWQRSETGSYGLEGSGPRFDRAYMTYSFEFPLTLAVGRFPTNMGPPTNQLDGLTRQGTYPRMAFNGIFDGAAAIYNFSSLLPEHNNFVFRAFYTPWSNVAMSAPLGTGAPREKQLQDGPNLRKVDSSTPMWALLAEYANTGIPFLGKLELDYMMYRYYSFYWDGFNYTNTGNNFASTPTLENPYISGRAQTVYLGLEDIGHIGLNASGSGLFYWSKDEDRDLTFMSSAYLINVNEKLKSWLPGLVIGGEYIKTDAYYYLDEWTYLNTIPFYKTPNAKGWHAYTAIPVADHLTARLGYYNLKQTPYQTVYATYSNEVKMSSVYGQLRLDF